MRSKINFLLTAVSRSSEADFAPCQDIAGYIPHILDGFDNGGDRGTVQNFEGFDLTADRPNSGATFPIDDDEDTLTLGRLRPALERQDGSMETRNFESPGSVVIYPPNPCATSPPIRQSLRDTVEHMAA